MIAYLSGKIIAKRDNFVILENNGVGYEIHLSEKSFKEIPQENEKAEFFCYTELNERGVKLFGFLSFEQLEFFKILRGIQGVGPRASLEIAGIDSPDKIQEQIEKGELSFLDGVPGIGKKKAAKIILELSGKIKTKEKTKEMFVEDEAFVALSNLGFPKNQIKESLLSLPENIGNTKEKIAQALKILSK